MDLCDSLSKPSLLNFHTKYPKELKGKYDRADPLFDAWIKLRESNYNYGKTTP